MPDSNPGAETPADWDDIMAAERVRAKAQERAEERWARQVKSDAEAMALLESLPIGWAEVLEEWQTCQVLLDDCGIDPGRGAQMGSNLDSRIARWVVPALGRLSRIAEAHHKQVDAHGGTDGCCVECSWRWPCPTYRWASGEGDPGIGSWHIDVDGETDA